MTKISLKIARLLFCFLPILLVNRTGFVFGVPKTIPLKMLWHTTIDPVWKEYPDALFEESDGDSFTTTKNTAYYIKAGQLVSSRLQNERILWKTGKDVNGVLSLFDGQIIARVGKYTVQAFSATTGKNVWQTKLPKTDIRLVTVMGDVCIVVGSSWHILLDGHTGRQRVQIPNEYQGYGPAVVYGNVVVWQWLGNGQESLEAFSIKTGKSLWNIGGGPIRIENSTMFVAPSLTIDYDLFSTELRKIDLGTGKVSSQTLDISSFAQKPSGGMGVGLLVDSESVWTSALDAKGWFVIRFNRNDLSKPLGRFDFSSQVDPNQIKFSGAGFFIYSPTGAVLGLPPGGQKGLIYKNSNDPIAKISVFGRWMVIVRESASIYSPTPKFKADRKGALQVIDLENGNIVAEAFPNLGDSITLQMQDRLLLLRSGPDLTVWTF